MTQRFNVLLFDGFSNHCLANMVEPLRAANTLSRQPLYAWRVQSLDGQPVQSSSGLRVTPDAALGQEAGDVLVVMPSYGFLRLDTPQVMRVVKSAARHHRKLAGLDCTPSTILSGSDNQVGRFLPLFMTWVLVLFFSLASGFGSRVGFLFRRELVFS